MISKFLLFATIFLFASCVSVDRNNPDDPGSDNYQRESEQKSSSSLAQSTSSSSVSVKNYCVYAELQQCYFGIYTACPGVGGVLSDTCPYSSSSSEAAYSSGQSQSGQSSSAAKEYDYCVFISEKMCLEGPLTNCPPGGALSNSCPYGSSSSAAEQSSSGTKPSSSSTASVSSSSNALTSSSSSSLSSSSLSLAQSSSSVAVVSSSSVATQSSSSVAQSSSSSSSIAITYTPACANVPTIGTAGTAITPPAVTCNDVAASVSNLNWTNAPNWNNPVEGTYTGITVSPSSGNCNGKIANCDGTLTVNLPFSKGNDIANYKKIQIGDQVWMAENLEYNVEGSVCLDKKPANCVTYGRLYDWVTAMALPASCMKISCASQISAKHQGICPSGWHIPSRDDWNILMKVANPSCSDNSNCADAATKLKATSGWPWYSGSPGVPSGTDELGFSALPGGYYNNGNTFSEGGTSGYWWSATEMGNGNIGYAYYRSMSWNGTHVTAHGMRGDSFMSIRCIKDNLF